MSDNNFILHELKSNTGNYDSEGGYRWVNVDGVKTKVYTKYLTGTLDNDASTSVAHGITNIDKILSCVAVAYNNDTLLYVVSEAYVGAFPNDALVVRYSGTNILFDAVGNKHQGQNYRIKIDYYL